MSKKVNNSEFNGFGPLQDRMLIAPEAAEQVTKGGIIIPGQENEVIYQGTVLAVGPKVLDRKVGERLLYGQYSGFEVGVAGSKYRLIREDDAYAILK